MSKRMWTVVVVLAAASLVPYEAQVPTFGCTSTDVVLELQRARTDDTSFQKLLYQEMFQGECILISKGAVVQGTIDDTKTPVLHLEAESAPPGFMAPLSDFKLKTFDEKQR